ncbi:hypothetical protein DESC_260046 [Desulfosarcina cetonica]|nr:hypothetical protein DESC_260046 [Desulfosarcina cetonica]
MSVFRLPCIGLVTKVTDNGDGWPVGSNGVAAADQPGRAATGTKDRQSCSPALQAEMHQRLCSCSRNP